MHIRTRVFFICSVQTFSFYSHKDWIYRVFVLRYVGITIIVKSFYSLWSMGHPRRASRHCSLQLSPLPHSMIFLCLLSHPLLSFATFPLSYLSFSIPEDSNLMQFSLWYLGIWYVIFHCTYILMLCFVFMFKQMYM